MVFRGRDHPGNVTQFKGWDGPVNGGWYTGPSTSDRPDRLRLRPGNERTIVNAVYNRIALDVASVETHHAMIDENEFYKEAVKDSLEEILNVEANVDQTAMAYAVDLVMSMFDEGVVAEVPIESEWVPWSEDDREHEMEDNSGPLLSSAQPSMLPAPKPPGNRVPSSRVTGGTWQGGSRSIAVVRPEAVGPMMGLDLNVHPKGQKRAIWQMRTARIVEWKPQTVIVECYDERTGRKERIEVCKRECCIHENPFYSIMNERNSIFTRLVRKLTVLDSVDNNLGSDKLNLIMQLPYIIRTEAKKAEARDRLKELETQLKDSPHGIGYVDGTEKIIQLNRPLENNLQGQIEWLTNLFFSQLGITQEILNGSADDKTMTNYMTRCVGVILEGICQERTRKLLTKEQRRSGEAIVYVQDPLRLIPVTGLADIFDKLSRNSILSPNECRGTLGFKPSDEPAADQLGNRNMPMQDTPEGQNPKLLPEPAQEEPSGPGTVPQ